MTSDTTSGIRDATIYYNFHEKQEYHVNLTLEKYLSKIQLNNSSKILDIGCGPGDITFKYLLSLAPENGAVIGIDKSQNMIRYANSNYHDPKLTFEAMDITDPSIGEKYGNTFDLIVSFFCFHWIQDQRSAMKNIYELLKPGGECILVFVTTSPVFNMYEILANSPRWKPYMKEYKNYVSPYHEIADPVQDVRNRMEQVGLQIKDSVCARSTYVFPSKEIYFESMEALNPFVSNIPNYLVKDFFEDCRTIFWKENFRHLEPIKEVTSPTTLMTVHANKLF